MYKVLIVTEDQAELNTISAIIDRRNYQLQIAGTLWDHHCVLRFLQDSNVDILILDLNCHSMDSIDLLRQIRNTHPNVHCILTAEQADWEYVQKVIPLGIENFLLKPLDPQILEETLASTIEKLHLERAVSFNHGTDSFFSSGAASSFMIDPAFKQYLLQQDHDACMKYLDRLFDSSASPAILRNNIVEVVVYVINIMRGYDINISKIVSDSTVLFHQILNFQDIQDLHFWMKNFLTSAMEELEGKNLRYSPCISRAVMHIKKNFAQDISLKTMACELNINAAYLGQLFKAETGQLFSVFLNQTRIDHAQKLLLNRNLSLNDISQQCGYANISYFYNIFKKHTGKTPTQYRKAQIK